MTYKNTSYYDWDARLRLRKFVLQYNWEDGSLAWRDRMTVPLFLKRFERKYKRRCARIEKRLALMK